MKKKILTLMIVVLVVGMIVTGTMSMLFVRNMYMEDLEERLVREAALIGTLLSREADINGIAIESGKLAHARVTIVDESGVVLGDSEAEASSLDNHLYREEINQAFETGDYARSTRYSNTLEKNLFYVAYPVTSNEGKYVIRLSVPIDELRGVDRSIFMNYLIALGAGLIISVLLASRLAGYIRKPLMELSDATEKISRGQYGEKVYLDYDDEMDVLAKNFNRMSVSLKNKVDEIEQINARIRAILENIEAGVIVTDNEMMIEYVNPSAVRKLSTNLKNVEGRLLLQVMRNVGLYDKILDSKDDKMAADAIIGEKHFRVMSTPIISEEGESSGFVIVLHDVTDIRMAEEMRKDFVANVSHELRTPLTSIKGFAETLLGKEGIDDNTKDRFLGIISLEASRLTTLVEDLLLLSEIEKREKEEFSVFRVRENALVAADMMKMSSEGKGMNFSSEISLDEKTEVYGKSDWFRQLLINLIDNGFKYNSEGGSVTLQVNEDSTHVVVKVIDDGIGIAAKDRDRIFERFYRVDKSRSKSSGGTGLGLAIVKHVVKMLRADITLDSKPGSGSIFTIKIPKA